MPAAYAESAPLIPPAVITATSFVLIRGFSPECSYSTLHPTTYPYAFRTFPLITTTQLDRNAIRRLIRDRRRELGSRERDHLSARLAANIIRSSLFRNSRTLALYLPNDGEVDLTTVAQAAWSMGKQCFLPVLSPLYHNRLWFAPYAANTLLVDNRFGIPEPALNWRTMRPVWSLDLLLMPLVAFDSQGNRLGMGGGFYDRTLAYLAGRRTWRKPHLIGTAFELQRFADLPNQPWDVPLEAVVTEQRYHHFG